MKFVNDLAANTSQQTYSLVFKTILNVCINRRRVGNLTFSIFNIEEDIYIQDYKQFFRYENKTKRFVFDKYITNLFNTYFGNNIIDKIFQ